MQMPPIVQMGTPSSTPGLPRIHAFAGHGVRIRHHSWFLSENATAAGNMLTTSLDILRRRSILGLNVEPRDLQDYDEQIEVRHYLMLQRGVATVFLYIGPAGYDLYISRATTVLTSIDPLRVIILVAGVLVGCVAPPIWPFLIGFLIFSFRHWLRERDFWFYLRRGHLNDFQLDDVSLLEQVTDDTLRAAAKHNNIDADKLDLNKAYPQGRRVRGV